MNHSTAWNEYRDHVEQNAMRDLMARARRARMQRRRLLARKLQRAFENGKDAGKRLATCEELPY